jgi:hypothetical protein
MHIGTHNMYHFINKKIPFVYALLQYHFGLGENPLKYSVKKSTICVKLGRRQNGPKRISVTKRSKVLILIVVILSKVAL